MVGELANERTTSSALYNFSVDLQFNAQVISSVRLSVCQSVCLSVCLQNACTYRNVFRKTPHRPMQPRLLNLLANVLCYLRPNSSYERSSGTLLASIPLPFFRSRQQTSSDSSHNGLSRYYVCSFLHIVAIFLFLGGNAYLPSEHAPGTKSAAAWSRASGLRASFSF